MSKSIKAIKPIKLGNMVRDVVTGFSGIASSKVEYLNGCIQFCVKPAMGKDGKMPEGSYIDVQQLEFVGNGVTVEQLPTGGDMPDMPKY